MDFKLAYDRDKALVDEALERCFSNRSAPYHRLLESMHYSLTAGGKRLRPVLVLAFCRACGGVSSLGTSRAPTPRGCGQPLRRSALSSLLRLG